MVAPVDQWCPSLKLVDEEAEKMGLIWIIEAFHAPLGHDAAIICGHDEEIIWPGMRDQVRVLIRSPGRAFWYTHIFNYNESMEEIYEKGGQGHKKRKKRK